MRYVMVCVYEYVEVGGFQAAVHLLQLVESFPDPII